MSSLPPNSEAHRDESSSNEKPGPADGKDLPEEAVKSGAEAADDKEKTVVPFLTAKTGGDNAKTGSDEKITADKTPPDGKAPEIKLVDGEGAAAKAPEPVVKQDPPMGRPIGSALVPFVPKSSGAEETKAAGAEAPRKKFLQSRAMQAAVLAAFVGLGWAAAGSFMGSHTTKPAQAQRVASTAVASPATAETGGETKKLNDDVKALKKEIETLRAALARNGNGDEIRSLKRSVESVKDNMESTRSDVASLSGKVDKMQHDPGKLREINDRLDHMERQGPATTASIAPVEPVTPKPAQVPLPPTKTIAAKPEASPRDTVARETGAREAPVKETVARAETKAEAPAPAAVKPQTAANTDKPQLLTNWVVRDVYRGIALVEGPRGSVEVVPGETIPGAGTVKSIERRGNGWIVVTSRGLVDSARN